MPRPGSVERRDQFTHRPGEVHSMAPQTIVHQNFAMIMFGVEENAAVGGAVRTGAPVRSLRLMALLATADHFDDIGGAEPWRFGCFASNVSEDAAHIVDVEAGIKRENVTVAAAAGHIAMGRAVPVRVGLPYLVARGASAAAGAFVVNGNGENGHHRQTYTRQREPQFSKSSGTRVV